jgi:hypothetical protein
MQWAMKLDNITFRDGQTDVLIAGIGVLPADLLVIRNYNSKTSNILTMLCRLITWSRRTRHLLCCFGSIMLRSNRCLPQPSRSLTFFHNSNVLSCWQCNLATFKMSFNFVGFGRPFGKSGGDGQFTCRQYSVAFVWIAESRFDHSRSLLFICSLNNVERNFSSPFRDDCYGCSVNCSKKIIWKANVTTFVIVWFFMKVSEYGNRMWLRKLFFWQQWFQKSFRFPAIMVIYICSIAIWELLFDFEIKNRQQWSDIVISHTKTLLVRSLTIPSVSFRKFVNEIDIERHFDL